MLTVNWANRKQVRSTVQRLFSHLGRLRSRILYLYWCLSTRSAVSKRCPPYIIRTRAFLHCMSLSCDIGINSILPNHKENWSTFSSQNSSIKIISFHSVAVWFIEYSPSVFPPCTPYCQSVCHVEGSRPLEIIPSFLGLGNGGLELSIEGIKMIDLWVRWLRWAIIEGNRAVHRVHFVSWCIDTWVCCDGWLAINLWASGAPLG